jgi:perosamine synthetase
MGDFIPVNEPDLGGNEKKYLIECIDSGWISSEGPYVKEFEDRFSKRVGRKYGVAVSNGSVALDAALKALNLLAGGEVIMPAFTIISCAAAIIRAGLTPVLVDAEPFTWNMDTAKIEAKITAKTKAIMMVHIYGLPTDTAPILELASKYKLKIIEDAAEMHGQTYNGKPCGSFGDVSTFSFYPNKNITTGEGGMIVTDSHQLAESCQSLRNLCFQPGRRFVHEELGFNFRLTNLQAALGVAQLERLDEFIVKKRRMGEFYTRHFSKFEELILPPVKTAYAENIYWVYGMVLSEKVDFEAQEMMARLAKLNIGSRPFFWGMHEQPVFTRMGLFQGEHYPVTERISRRGFYIPSGLGITEEQQTFAVEAVKKALSKIW